MDRGHALVGRIWDTRARAFVNEAKLLERARGAGLVLVGERHDNPDHHRLQARVLKMLVELGRRPAVVFEMLDVEQQSAIDQYLARPGASAAGFGAALGWNESGWPAFEQYQPIFDVLFAARSPVVAGNLPRPRVRALVQQGLDALGERRARELGLDRSFPPALEQSLLEALRASHCGHLPESMLAPMALAQHARDAQMADVLISVAKADAVLIAGSDHVRRDRGVPYYVTLRAPAASLLTLALFEVDAERLDPASYVAAGPDAAPVFDFAWFTPRASDEDPCAAFRKP